VGFHHGENILNEDFLLFQLLEEHIVTFVKNELKKFKKVLGPEDPQSLEGLKEDDEDEEQRNSNREAILELSLNFLRNMKETQLADALQSSKMFL